MADGIRTHYKLWDGTKWVKYWFTTSADAIHEVTDRRFVTDDQKDLLDLGTNVANGLLKLNASKKVDITLLPDLSGTYALVGHDHDTVYSKLNHNHSGVYEPVFTKKTAFNKDFAGTGTATTVARSDHDHDGIYEPVITKNSGFNLNLANTTQAEAGTVNNVLMTPLRTKEAILKLAPAPADATDTVKGIVKLSGNFNADTPDINTALSQTGAKNLYNLLKGYADTVAGMGFNPQQEVDLAYVRESDSPNNITISDFGSRPPAPQFPADDDSITQLRVLISGRTNKVENGIYNVVKNTTGLEGSWKWQLELSSQDHGAIVFVKGGTHNDTIWYYNKTTQVWNQFSRMDTIHDSTTIKKASQQYSGFQLEIIPGSIGSSHIALGAVNSNHLGTSSVTTEKISAGAVTSSELDDNAVITDKINNGAVTAGKLASNAVTNAKISSNAVTSAKISSGAVTSAKLADNAVITDKINDGAVTEDKIADLAISNDKIANKTISNSKIKDYTIVATSIADGAVITRTIGPGAVTGIKIADGAVTEDKLATSVKEQIKKITVGITAPSDPNEGDVWLDTSVS